MSQQKVDKYKEQKARRKEIVEKERRDRKMRKDIAALNLILVIAGIGAGIGITIRNLYIKAQNAKPDYTESSLVVQDMAGILETETSADAAGGETSADEANAEETAQAAETEAATEAAETQSGN